MLEVTTILKNAAEKAGLIRSVFEDKSVPSNISDVCVMPFFGDIRSMTTLSSLLLKRYREEAKGSKYFVLCSWPGMESLFPYVNEYWAGPPTLFQTSMGFDNSATVGIIRKLNHYFEEVVTTDDFGTYYKDGFRREFFDRFRNVQCYKPNVPSSAVLGNSFNRELSERKGQKVFVHPVTSIVRWKDGRLERQRVGIEFWNAVVTMLLENNYVPVVWQDFSAHDLSREFMTKCMYLVGNNMAHVLSAMRATGCVLDLFEGLSRLAIVSRCPYVACDDRTRYNVFKEFEYVGLCADGIPREYIFTFPTTVEDGEKATWNDGLFPMVLNRLRILFKDMDRNSWPSTSESNVAVPYSVVRRAKARKLGTRFVKVPRI